MTKTTKPLQAKTLSATKSENPRSCAETVLPWLVRRDGRHWPRPHPAFSPTSAPASNSPLCRRLRGPRSTRSANLVKRRSFTDIAADCGVSDMTVIRCAGEYGIPSRATGIASHPQMIATLDPTLHRDLRRAVEGGLHGWQRLRRFRTVMNHPTIDAAAAHLAVDQSTLVRQLQRLETDIGGALYYRATIAHPHRPTRRGTTLLHALDHPVAQQHLATATTRGTKSNAQLPRKDDVSAVLNYHGSRRKRP